MCLIPISIKSFSKFLKVIMNNVQNTYTLHLLVLKDKFIVITLFDKNIFIKTKCRST